jgi:UDP-N-acetylmuramoyl-L-alanyl-D-glutamate--2,6-diaminopimelate ligase
MRKALSDLLSALPQPYILTGDASTPITAPVTDDHREIERGGVFIARRGATVDGHDFIPQVLERGAAAVIGERDLNVLSTPYVRVENAMEATGYLAAAYHDFPSRKLNVIGVTGTDGKTTTSTLIHSILKTATGDKTGLISTISADIGGAQLDTGFHVTTPGAPMIQKLLAQMIDHGVTHVVIEMTSHGLAQGRLNGIDTDIAVLTNLTHEHLDYHGTFENYRAAKARLFEMVGKTARKPHQPKISVVNGDDPNADFFAAFPADHHVRYAAQRAADFRATDLIYHPGYTQFALHTPNQQSTLMHLPLLGDFNVMNALAAVAVTRQIGVLLDDIQRGLLRVTAIPGRLERIDEGQDFLAVVDFAHTPNALRNALQAARTMTGHGGRVICIFGCAGLRDREKRRLMPEHAIQRADFSIFTAEDPRTESLDEILRTMAHAAAAVGGIEGEHFIRVSDRGEALVRACDMARAGDVVIACGKGHEQSMAFGTVEYLWDDRDAMRAALHGAPLQTLPTASS